jgi:hypothetical protein
MLPTTQSISKETKGRSTSTDTTTNRIFGALRNKVFVVVLALVAYSLGSSTSTISVLAYVPGSASQQNKMNEEDAMASMAQEEMEQPAISFFLYPFKVFPSFWGENSTCDHSKILSEKHDHADFAWQAMQQHPWRTTDPSAAQLAILPLSLDLWARNGCGEDVRMATLKNEVRTALHSSPIFPSVRHLIFASDFKTKAYAKQMMEVLSPAGIQTMSEHRANDDCRIGIGHTSNYAVSMSMRSPNHVEMPDTRRTGAERIYSVHMVGQVDGRAAYSDRLALFNSTGPIPSPYIVATERPSLLVHQRLRHCDASNDFDRCLVPDSGRSETQYTQELSNYTLCLRGDTLGSDRWINAMVAGTAIIQVAEGGDAEKALAWLPFQSVIPWKDLVITIPTKSFRKDPAAAIRHVLATTSEERLLELQRLSLHYATDLDWSAYHSRMLENLIRGAVSVPCAKFDQKNNKPARGGKKKKNKPARGEGR